jgi:hypothetical protein
MKNERVLYYNSKSREIIMPNELGIMDKQAPIGDAWFLIKWPVNPHFTGEYGIREMLLHDEFTAVFNKAVKI